MKLVGFAFLLVLCIGTGNSMRCLTCENQPDDIACRRFGKIERCKPLETTCENQVRSINTNDRVAITKRCKQRDACLRNQEQNPRPAWHPSQCNTFTPASTCTCCCDEDLCNHDRFCVTNPEPMCPNLGGIGNGTVTCTDGRNIGSDCRFQCNEGFELVPGDITLRCGTDEMWNGTKPCCLELCSRTGYFDLVFALDMSTSVGQRNWDLVINFTQAVINRFPINEATGSQIGVFAFSRSVFENSRIVLNAHRNSRQALLTAVEGLTYRGISGTNTATALRYAGSDMFTSANGDRPDATNVLVVVTDGRSPEDNVVQEAETLRANGVRTYAVRIGTPINKAAEDQINGIAGSPSNLLVVDILRPEQLDDLATKIETFLCSRVRRCNN